jgi:hypothetical protein
VFAAQLKGARGVGGWHLAQNGPHLVGAVLVVESAGPGVQVGARFVVGAVEFARDSSKPEAVVDARPVRPVELSQRPADVRRAHPKSHVCCNKKRQILSISSSRSFSFHPILDFAAPSTHFPIRFSASALRFAFPSARRSYSHWANYPGILVKLKLIQIKFSGDRLSSKAFIKVYYENKKNFFYKNGTRKNDLKEMQQETCSCFFYKTEKMKQKASGN